MSDFDSEVIQNAAFSMLKSAGIYTLWAGEAILSATQGFTDWMIEIFVEDKGFSIY